MATDYGSKKLRKILIVSLSNISSDPRVLKQIDLLSPFYTIDVMGFGEPPQGVSKFIGLSRVNSRELRIKRKIVKALFLLFRHYKAFYFYDLCIELSEINDIYSKSYDLIIANDFSALPLVETFAYEKTKILLDAHEYHFDELNSFWRKKVYLPFRKWVVTNNSTHIVGMMTVSDGLAKLYKDDLDINEIAVVRNIPKQNLLAFERRVKPEIALIHHGAAIKGRGITEIIDLVQYLDQRFTLNLMLVQADKIFLQELERLAKPLGKRVNFLPIVPTQDISGFISRFDLGIHILSPLSANNVHALPNKFFEFMQANLAIAIGPSPEMAHIVHSFSLGVVAPGFDIQSMARELNSLDREQIEIFRENSYETSKTLSWENESGVLLRLVDSCIDGKS
jgi:hypothetical protein